MLAIDITSASNDRFKTWKKVSASPRAIRKEGVTLAEGLHLAMAARDARVPVRAVILKAGRRDAETDDLAQAIADESTVQGVQTKVFFLDDQLFEEISPVEHGAGIMIEIDLPEKPAADDRIRKSDVLYLDGVQDAGNAGTLIRTAVASGVRVIAASRKTASLWAPKVMRSAMGAHFGAVILEGIEPFEAKTLFDGRFLAADARGGHDIYAEEGWEKGPTVWMMGAEGPGLSDAALEVADERLYIPIESETESLNVAAAAAVCLFEQRRRRLRVR